MRWTDESTEQSDAWERSYWSREKAFKFNLTCKFLIDEVKRNSQAFQEKVSVVSNTNQQDICSLQSDKENRRYSKDYANVKKIWSQWKSNLVITLANKMSSLASRQRLGKKWNPWKNVEVRDRKCDWTTNYAVKVKNDHQSKFSTELSNWKEEAWKN